MPNFYNILRARKFTTVADTAMEISAHDSATPNFAIEAGGKLKWSSGSDNADTTLYRSAANTLKTDDSFDIAAGHTYKIDGDDVLTATTLGSTIVNSSLTSLGNLISLNAATPNFTGPTVINGSLTVTGTVTASNIETDDGSLYSATIGDGVNSSFVITHNLNTRDVFVSFRENGDDYENLNVAWEATTVDTITVNLDSPPATNSIRVLIYSSLPSNYSNPTINLEDIENVNIVGVSPENFLKWDGTNWVNASSINSIKVNNSITMYSSATPNSFILNESVPIDALFYPFALLSPFPVGMPTNTYRYPLASIDAQGNITANSINISSDNRTKNIITSNITGDFGAQSFTIQSDGEMNWFNNTNGAEASLTFGGSFDSGRLTINANVTINSQRSLTSQFTYNNSVGAVRDVFITSSGLLGVNLSSEKYKEDIVNIEIDPQKVYQIQPVEFKYKEGHINEEAKDQRFIGLIAEQLDEIGLTQFVEYDENGSPDSVKYSMLSLALIESVKDLNNRITELEKVNKV